MSTIIVWFVLALLAGVLGAEAVAWCRPLQRLLLRRAASVLPRAHAERYLEEWYRELEELPDGPLTRLAWVVFLVLRRGSLARSLGVPRSVVGLTGGLKRSMDVSLALLALVMLGPLMLLIAWTVKLQDGGPVLFRQERIGRDGKPFTMLKFRSMVLDAEKLKRELMSRNEGKGGLFMLSDDPRITPLGRFLRDYSLDELPQLFHVVRGSMSLVGPRPHLEHELVHYPPEALRRSAAMPGMSGLWQVSGRSDLEGDEAIRLDLRYVEKWSLRLDLWILLKTIPTVLEKRGAR